MNTEQCQVATELWTKPFIIITQPES